MAGLLPDVDPDGLLEFSVVYTDRSLNHMSKLFQKVMQDISATLKEAYNAHSVTVVPGGGTFGMEAVARQFATGKKCLVVRNGWFSYRWTQIFDAGLIPSECIVLKAQYPDQREQPPFKPPQIDMVVAEILAKKPEMIFATHVETAAGMLLPDQYIRALADAVHSYDGLLVLDCIASGALWVNMQECGVDILISAPQKGWSSSPCCGLVMMSATARNKIDQSASTSFACDLRKWLQIMELYEKGQHGYHATMPTDSLRRFRDTMLEIKGFGFEKARQRQLELGARVRALFADLEIKSVAAEGYQAPGVVVSYTEDQMIQSGKKFAEQGLQIAAGVPLQCDEPHDYRTFRIGLFGLEKLQNLDRTVSTLKEALEKVFNDVLSTV